jgi:twitching motility protein PilT
LVVATEILMQTPAVANVIREGKAEQLRSLLQTGSQFGMQTLDNSLLSLYKDGIISLEDAKIYARDPNIFSPKPK